MPSTDSHNLSESTAEQLDAEQLDRNMIELLNELRVSGTGVQVLLAFLFVVPLNVGHRRFSAFDRIDYFAALLFIAAVAVMFIAPSVHHRLLFHHHQRAYIVATANRAAIAGLGFVAIGLVAILALISNLVFGVMAAVCVAVGAAALLSGFWFASPLWRRRLAAVERPAAAAFSHPRRS